MTRSKLIKILKLAIFALEVKPNYVVKPRVTSGIVIGKLKEVLKELEESTVYTKDLLFAIATAVQLPIRYFPKPKQKILNERTL